MSRKVDTYKAILDTADTKKSGKSRKTTVSASKAEAIVKDPLADSAKQADTNGANFLGSLLHATIFFDYFEYVAGKTYRGDSIEQKVLKLKTVHPNFHKLSVTLDMAVVIIAVVVLIAAAACAIFKVILG